MQVRNLASDNGRTQAGDAEEEQQNNENLHYLYYSTNITRLIKLRMWWERHAA